VGVDVSRGCCCLLIFVFVTAGTGVAAASSEPGLAPGTIEVGLAGASTTVNGSTNVTAALRSGSFLGIGRAQLLGYEAEVAYTRIRDLDRLDVFGNLAWLFPVGSPVLLPSIGFSGGLRQEWLGSFSNARGRLGATLGLRTLASRRVAARVEYRFVRLFDSQADFNEHEVVFGLSILFRNRP
jgi:hypothetical protein